MLVSAKEKLQVQNRRVTTDFTLPLPLPLSTRTSGAEALMLWKRMPASSQRMSYSRSLAPPLTEQDLCEPKFSLLVEKVWSSLDYNAVDEVRRAWWRIAVFDGQMWKHFEALQGKEESEKPRKPFLKYLFLPVDEVRRVWWRIVVFDGQMWEHFEVLQGEEESEKPRKPFLKCRFLLRRNLAVHKDKWCRG